jgi:hypothetical protein
MPKPDRELVFALSAFSNSGDQKLWLLTLNAHTQCVGESAMAQRTRQAPDGRRASRRARRHFGRSRGWCPSQRGLK